MCHGYPWQLKELAADLHAIVYAARWSEIQAVTVAVRDETSERSLTEPWQARQAR